MRARWFLPLLGLWWGAAAAQEPDWQTRFREGFTTDPRGRYEIAGDVAWQKGELLLKPGARLTREIGLGPHGDLQLRLRWADGAAGTFRLQLADQFIAVPLDLIHAGDGTRLAFGAGARVRTVTVPGTGRAWRLRVRADYGLLRARAWPDGDPEPDDWQHYHAAGISAWQPGGLRWEAAGADVRLADAVLRGTPRRTVANELIRRAVALEAQAAKLTRAGKHAEALALHDRQLALVRESFPDQHALVEGCLQAKAKTLMRLERWAEAGRVLAEALALLRREMPAHHPSTAAVLFNLGHTELERGDFAGARGHLAEALATLRLLYPPEFGLVLNAESNLGMAEYALGDWRPAEKRLRANLARMRRALPAAHLDLANTLLALGNVSLRLNATAEAGRYFEEALVVYRRLDPKHPGVALALSGLGYVEGHRGRWDRDQQLQEEALERLRQAGNERHPAGDKIRVNLGVAYLELGQPDQARQLLESAAAEIRRHPDAHLGDFGPTLSTLGVAYQRLGRPDQALRVQQEALAVLKQALPPDHPEIRLALGSLGVALYNLRRDDEARRVLEEVLAIHRRRGETDTPGLAVTLHNLGLVRIRQRDWDGARRDLEAALAVQRKARPPEHPDQALGLITLAAYHAERGEPDAAFARAAEACALSARYQRLLAATLGPRLHARFWGTQRRGLDLLLTVAMGRPELTADRRHELARRALEQKALSLHAQVLRQEALQLGRDDAGRELLGRLKEARQQLADLLLHGPGLDGPDRYRERWQAARRRLDGLETQVGRRVEGDVARDDRGQPDPAALAARLPAGTALIELVAYQRFRFRDAPAAPHYAALLLTRDAPQVRVVFLGPAAPLDEAVYAWRKRVQKGASDPAAEKLLREKLWGPLARALPAGLNQLVIAPDGGLALFPFEALRLDDGTYLVEKLAVRYVTTARDLLPRPAGQAGPARAVVLSDPAYDALPAADTAAPTSPGQVRSPDLRPGALTFRRLAGFGREATAVARLLGERPGWQVERLDRERATEERLAAVKRPRLLYLITHGFFLRDGVAPGPAGARDLDLVELDGGPRLPSPGEDARLRSGLALAGANRWQERARRGLSDGLLTALEAENLDLTGTDLVVLSACETGLGEVRVGEGVIGLRRGFQLAGAATVVASLWRVPDAETEQLMTRFLGRWLKGEGKAAALRQAQLAMIRSLRESGDAARRAAPPLYWAGFVCHGRGD